MLRSNTQDSKTQDVCPDSSLERSPKVWKMRRKRSVIWNYFTPIDESRATCHICKLKVAYKTSVTNLRSHLRNRHREIDLEPEDPSRTQQWQSMLLLQLATTSTAGGFNHTNSAVRKGSSASREEGTDTEDSAAQDTIDSSGWQDESPSNDLADTAPEERSEPRDPLALNTTVPNYVYVNVDSDDEEDRKPKRMRTFEEPETPAPRTTVQPPLPAVRNVNLTQDQMETEFEAFGRSVAAQLKNIPFHVALRLQLKIQTLITEERLKVMSGSRD
ncbi:uncharacterized protein LOC124165965 isoform X3 [Ischnura elegans]|uniref:uncharacterized protein LOC124165965 isoform X3 n=1 Tax=Ischnura elegans TaxID=197161 RepID=UPI001ED878EA|nr:uncharacterized protein LOC124165965 isoform X3 [Ischnura elegans]